MQCQIETCFTISNITALDIFNVNAFQIGALPMTYFNDCFSSGVFIMNIFSCFSILSAFVNLLIFGLRKSLVSVDTELLMTRWIVSRFIPLLTMIWTILLGITNFSMIYFQMTSITMTFIQFHLWIEICLAISGIIILTMKEISRRALFQVLSIISFGFFLHMIFAMMTGSVILRGYTNLFSMLTDLLNPTVFVILAFRNHRIDFIFYTILFFLHDVYFYLPLVFCYNLQFSMPVTMCLIVIFQIFSFVWQLWILKTHTKIVRIF